MSTTALNRFMSLIELPVDRVINKLFGNHGEVVLNIIEDQKVPTGQVLCEAELIDNLINVKG